MKDNFIYLIALMLVIIGGLNWGLLGLLNLNLVTLVFGESLFTRILYLVIGVSSGYLAYTVYLEYANK
ncbi:MAG: DUF378 domain-containing protein [bacterium]